MTERDCSFDKLKNNACIMSIKNTSDGISIPVYYY